MVDRPFSECLPAKSAEALDDVDPNVTLDRPPRCTVSVIVPVRNEQSSIQEVLERLLGQDLVPHEILITDGGSRDHTRDIVREFIQSGHPIRLVEDANAFPGRARNLGLEQARSSWVAMTDAGTIIPRTWLGALVRQANEPEGVDVVCGSYEPILSSFFDECVALAFVPPAKDVHGLPFRGPTTASLLVRREVWESLGRFPEHLRACEDLLFFERLDASHWSVVAAPEATVAWKIPCGFRAVFRRFRVYSQHTLQAGLGRTWHRALGRNWLLGLLLVLLAIFHHWVWAGLLLLALIGRTHRSIRLRRPWLKLNHVVGVRSYVLVSLILLWIDLAALVGCVDWLVGKGARMIAGLHLKT